MRRFLKGIRCFIFGTWWKRSISTGYSRVTILLGVCQLFTIKFHSIKWQNVTFNKAHISVSLNSVSNYGRYTKNWFLQQQIIIVIGKEKMAAIVPKMVTKFLFTTVKTQRCVLASSHLNWCMNKLWWSGHFSLKSSNMYEIFVLMQGPLLYHIRNKLWHIIILSATWVHLYRGQIFQVVCSEGLVADFSDRSMWNWSENLNCWRFLSSLASKGFVHDHLMRLTWRIPNKRTFLFDGNIKPNKYMIY